LASHEENGSDAGLRQRLGRVSLRNRPIETGAEKSTNVETGTERSTNVETGAERSTNAEARAERSINAEAGAEKPNNVEASTETSPREIRLFRQTNWHPGQVWTRLHVYRAEKA
jgi:hypothetical protein